MTKQELHQKLMICVSTLMNLNGCMPGAPELYSALGSEYEEVLEEYLANRNIHRAAA